MKDVVVDLETLDNVPGGVILSIGAVAFDWRRDCLGPEFETVVDVNSCKRAGLVVNPDTLAWWQAKPEAARKVLDEAYSGQAQALRYALLDFNTYLDQFGDGVRVHGNGSDFDNAFLAVAMRAVGLTPKWNFWDGRCFRTLKNLFREFYKLPMPEFQGTPHNALDDAKHEARMAMVILEHLADLQSLHVTIANAKAQPGTLFTDIPNALDVRYLPSTTKDIDENDAVVLTAQKLDDSAGMFVEGVRVGTVVDSNLWPEGKMPVPLDSMAARDLTPAPWPDGKSPSVLEGVLYPKITPLQNNVPRDAPREIRDFTPTYLNMDSKGGVSLGGYVGAPPAGFPEVGTLVIPADRSKPAYVELGDNTPVDLPVGRSAYYEAGNLPDTAAEHKMREDALKDGILCDRLKGDK